MAQEALLSSTSPSCFCFPPLQSRGESHRVREIEVQRGTSEKNCFGGTLQRILQIVVVFLGLHAVVQEGLLLRRRVRTAVALVGLGVRGRADPSGLGAVAHAVAEVDCET